MRIQTNNVLIYDYDKDDIILAIGADTTRQIAIPTDILGEVIWALGRFGEALQLDAAARAQTQAPGPIL